MTPQVGKNFAVFNICSWDIHRDPLSIKTKMKYQSWYLTPYCGLEVQKPTQILQLVKGLANYFDWNPKWVRTLPSLICFFWDIYRDPPPSHERYIKVLAHLEFQSMILPGSLTDVPHLKPTSGCRISTLICSEVPCSGIFPTL
jgi:hypothetical protein